MDDLFNEVMERTARARRKKLEKVREFTEEEDERLDYWIEDMVDYIKKRADKGKHEFAYDCSRLSKYMFEELAFRFRQRYSKFMVIKDGGRQHITVKWKTSYEV